MANDAIPVKEDPANTNWQARYQDADDMNKMLAEQVEQMEARIKELIETRTKLAYHLQSALNYTVLDLVYEREKVVASKDFKVLCDAFLETTSTVSVGPWWDNRSFDLHGARDTLRQIPR